MSNEKLRKSETEEFVEDNLVCRQIVKEIMALPVSQRQIYFIMNLLSLELENVDHMRELTAALREMREDTHVIDRVDRDNEKFLEIHEENIVRTP